MNGPLPELTAEYTAENLAACEKVLRTLLSAIETRWRERIVVVGGMVPLYLYDEDDIPDELDPHIGTVDLDIGVGILVDEGDVEAYTALEQKITRLGFERADADNQWRWARRVDGVRVLLEFLGPVSEGDTPGEQTREPIGGSGNLYALAVRGIELVPRDCIRVELEGELLDDGGRRSITAQVANHLPFLMLKAFAFEERVKFKDSYDVVCGVCSLTEMVLSESRRQLRKVRSQGIRPWQMLSIFFGNVMQMSTTSAQDGLPNSSSVVRGRPPIKTGGSDSAVRPAAPSPDSSTNGNVLSVTASDELPQSARTTASAHAAAASLPLWSEIANSSTGTTRGMSEELCSTVRRRLSK